MARSKKTNLKLINKKNGFGSKSSQFVLVSVLVFASVMTLISAISSRAIPGIFADTKNSALPSTMATSITPTPDAVSVLSTKYGLTGNAANDPDATAAFGAAISDAIASSVRYLAGPNGGAQAVVYVPAGSYRLNGLILPSNVRMEIDAGAVLEPIVKPAHTLTVTDPIQLIQMGTADKTNQVSNVSIVGVNSVMNTLKQRAVPTYNNWDISNYFTVDLDPTDSGSSNDMAFATLINVKDFLISNIYSIQNNAIPACTAVTYPSCPLNRGPYPSPTSARSVIVYKPSNQSSLPPGPFYDPTNGTLSNMYNIHGPYGFGPTQITAGHNLTFNNIYSDGGTTMRLETDDTSKTYGAELKTVNGNNIVGTNCNRAVSLSAHKQANSDVHFTNVTAINCNNGLEQSADNATGSGTFLSSTVDQLNVVGGATAQIPVTNSGGLWKIGTSVNAVDVDPGALAWSANLTNFSCSGTYTAKNGKVTLNGSTTKQIPVCSGQSVKKPKK